MDKTPYETFTNNRPDYIRDFRVEWGEPIVVKIPKGISSDLKVTGRWAIVVRHIMNGRGVLKVYLIQAKRYAYHLRFTRAVAPEWVLENLKGLNDGTHIGFEEESQPVDKALTKFHEEEEIKAEVLDKNYDQKLDDNVEIIGNLERAQVVLQSIISAEDAWHKMAVKHEIIKDEKDLEEEAEAEEAQMVTTGSQAVPGTYITRSGRVSRPTMRLI
jgi:hypothetical protein